jgi:hypothetical protein
MTQRREGPAPRRTPRRRNPPPAPRPGKTRPRTDRSSYPQCQTTTSGTGLQEHPASDPSSNS